MWNTEMSTIVRYLVNDTDLVNPSYPDERIETTILVAAQLVSTEVDFEQSYSINVEQCLLSPDPTLGSDKDDGFINLVSLKAACIIIGSEYKTHSLSAIRVSDGPSSIDMNGVASNFRQLYESLCSKYESVKLSFVSNNNVGEAILSPYGSYWSGNYGRRSNIRNNW